MLSLILLQQIAQLFIIIFLGWAIVKAGILKSEDSRVLSMLLLYVIIPCVILNAFQIERTTDTVRMMELSLLSALMMNVLSLVLGRLSAKPVSRTAPTWWFRLSSEFGVKIGSCM